MIGDDDFKKKLKHHPSPGDILARTLHSQSSIETKPRFDGNVIKPLIAGVVVNYNITEPIKSLPSIEPNWFFVGRNTYLSCTGNNSIWENLLNKKMVVLHGLKGQGKTQVAKKYVYKYADKYDIVGWIDVGKTPSMSMRNFLNEIFIASKNPTNISELDDRAVKHTLKTILKQKASGNWLLIFDNTKKLTDKFIEDYIPIVLPERKHLNSHIIFTTWRYSSFNYKHSAIEVVPFEPSESVLFLFKTIRNTEKEILLDDNSDNINDIPASFTSEAINIAEKLKRYPLALAQAASYIKYKLKGNISIYLSQFRMFEKESNAQFQHHSIADGYHSTVKTVSIMMFAAMRHDGGDIVDQLLYIFKFINNTNIPKPLLVTWSMRFNNKNEMKLPLQIKYINNAIEILVSYNFLRLENSKNNIAGSVAKIELTHKISSCNFPSYSYAANA